MFVAEPKTPEQLEAIALDCCIKTLSRRLERGDYGADGDSIDRRSSSPPPEYDRYGKRTNTREQRMNKELEVERTLAVYKALELIPHYAPPASFTKLTASQEKYFLPVRQYPHINFVGLLLGPRGTNLRRMESESGARICIRGRGSVKEGGRTTQQGFDEDLHCLVSAIVPRKIASAFKLIEEVVNTATETPEHQNDFKRLQLRQLAELNGTLRDYENQPCNYCYRPGHRKHECPERNRSFGRSNEQPFRQRVSNSGYEHGPSHNQSPPSRHLSGQEAGHASAPDLRRASPPEEKATSNEESIPALEEFLTEIDSADQEAPGSSEIIASGNSPAESSSAAPNEAATIPAAAPKGPPGLSSPELAPLKPPGMDDGEESAAARLLSPPAAFDVPHPPPPTSWKPPSL